MRNNDHIVSHINRNSIAHKYGLRQGDNIIALNGNKNFDIIDYMLVSAEESFSITVSNANDTKTYQIKNPDWEPIGIHFENLTIDAPRRCHNQCVFCFMDQLPNGMRSTLSFKDDDYRLSFTSGNYVTLTNVNDEELQRIIDLKLSPMHISVHTTNAQLREAMMHNRKAGNIMRQLNILASGGVSLNLQLVLCPGLNDGPELARTLDDILSIGSMVNSLSCVPVGLTQYRENLESLRLFDKRSAVNVIETIDRYRAFAELQFSDPLFYASDEFFLVAEKPFPPDSYYGIYPQYENGVGMSRSLIDLITSDIDNLVSYQSKQNDKIRALIVTGVLGEKVLSPLIQRLTESFQNYDIYLKAITNHFFGETITASGLICGQDIIRQINNYDYPYVILPSNMLKDDEPVFLDDTSLSDLERSLGKKILIASFDGSNLIDILQQCKEHESYE